MPTTPVLSRLRAPIVLAPMAGGPSTPELAAAVHRGGGLGFLAAGYRTVAQLEDELAALRSLGVDTFGVNVFAAPAGGVPRESVAGYARELSGLARRAGVALGEPRDDDDALAAKLALLGDRESAAAVVSFTFGLPSGRAVRALHAVGSEVWATVTSPAEAVAAAALGVDALVLQGVEAGGHRGVFTDDESASELTVLALLALVRDALASELPLVAAGAIVTGETLAAVLVAGAAAGQVGTAYLRSDEAGTSGAHRDAVASDRPTVLTRAFSGRLARGIENRWQADHGARAPRAYPAVHHLTAPLRAHGRAVGDGDLINLWAGQTHRLAPEGPAQAITEALARDARAAIERARERLGG